MRNLYDFMSTVSGYLARIDVSVDFNSCVILFRQNAALDLFHSRDFKSILMAVLQCVADLRAFSRWGDENHELFTTN